jgi:hypothetical protein
MKMMSARVIFDGSSRFWLPVDFRLAQGALRSARGLPNSELRIMRYELTDYEWAAISPMSVSFGGAQGAVP